MSKEDFQNALHETIEYLTQYELSPTAKKLVRFYFNESKADTSYERALESIERYFPESIPPENETPPRLRKLLDNLKREADVWDRE